MKSKTSLVEKKHYPKESLGNNKITRNITNHLGCYTQPLLYPTNKPLGLLATQVKSHGSSLLAYTRF